MGPLGGHSGVCVVFTALVAMHLYSLGIFSVSASHFFAHYKHSITLWVYCTDSPILYTKLLHVDTPAASPGRSFDF